MTIISNLTFFFLQISYLIIEWTRLGETNPMQRFTLIIFILMILLFNI